MAVTGDQLNRDGGEWSHHQRWLVRSPNPLGDACMSLPAVRALKRSRPNLHLAVCCRENLAPMWVAQPEVDEVVTFPKNASPLAVGRLLKTCGRFDAGLLLPNSFRSALELRLGGVRRLVGYARYQRSLLLRKAVKEVEPSPERRHHVHRYLSLVKAIGIPVEPVGDFLAIPAAPTPISAITAEIHLGLCPGAEYGNAKRYPVERFAEAVSLVRERHPDLTLRVSIFGSPAERSIGEDLAARLDPPGRNRAGETSVGDLVEELRTCHLVVTNDTGTMHLAAALGVPTVAIFGSTDPTLTAPTGDGHRVVRHPVECSPCFLRECPIDYRCMLRIEPAAVAAAVDEIIGRGRAEGNTL